MLGDYYQVGLFDKEVAVATWDKEGILLVGL